MQQADLVPLRSVLGERGGSGGLTVAADRGQSRAVLGAGRGEILVLGFGGGQHSGHGAAQRRLGFADRAAQEHPAALLAAARQGGIAEDADVARYARLALPQNLRKFAHRQLHRGKKAHDSQTGQVGKGAKGGVNVHGLSIVADNI